MNGGYSGTMEAVSEGAVRVPGAQVEGVTSPSTFPDRVGGGNRFLTIETKAVDIQQVGQLALSQTNATHREIAGVV
jgi:predicted Rossmann-fold nucleotide-binding protein